MTKSEEWQVLLVENAAKRLSNAAAKLASQAQTIAEAGYVVGEALRGGNKVLVAGNGGSAACAQHFAAEFTGKLALDRAPLSALALTVDTSAITAIANDWSYEEVFSRQVRAHGRPGDVFVGLSTSGSSRNIRRAVEAATELGLKTIVLTGPTNGLGGEIVVTTAVRETARVQEIHDLVLHSLAQIAERVVFPELGDDASADRSPFLLDETRLTAFREWCDSTGQTLVTTNGVFDLLHEGHINSLSQSRTHGDQLVVLVNSDDSVRRLKGEGRPVQLFAERALQLQRSRLVDHIIEMSQDTPVELLRMLRPDVHCKGEEYVTRPLPEREVVESYGGRVELLNLQPGLSTSAVIDRIKFA